MSTASDEIKARYTKVERESDELGRVIGVRRLRPSQIAAIEGFTPEFDGVTISKDSEGREVEVSKRTPFLIAASVCELDETPIPFPKNRAELNAIFDNLDSEGLTGAIKAFSRLFGTMEAPEAVATTAKKSHGTR